jgi:hypothetical protein
VEEGDGPGLGIVNISFIFNKIGMKAGNLFAFFEITGSMINHRNGPMFSITSRDRPSFLRAKSWR